MTISHQNEVEPSPSVIAKETLRFLRRRWKSIVVGTMVGILLAALWSISQTPRYTSTTSALVSVAGGESIGIALTADNLAKSKAQQYVELGNSRAVAEAATAGLSFPLSNEAAMAATDVVSMREGPILTITAEALEPAHAQELAAAWTQALADRVQSLEGQTNGGPTDSSIVSITVLSDATRPASPSWPNIPLVLALGALVGLVAGFILAAVRHLLDNKIRSVSVLKDDFGLSVLGTIPLVGRTKRRARVRNTDRKSRHARIFVEFGDADAISTGNERPSFHVTEAFKELRTNIEFLRPDNAPRVITITSSHPGEGKSTVASNLAVTMAQTGKPIVIIDADLRRPLLAKTFGLVEGVGVTDIMVGHAAVDDVMQYIPALPSLTVLGAGKIPPNPSEILGSERFRDMVLDLAQEAFVIIDAPPLLPVTDAAILARRFDGCLVVVGAGETTADELNKAVSTVKSIDGDVLGVVLNRIPTTGAEASSYQYYGKSYYYDESFQQ